MPGSPCIDAGTNSLSGLPELDLDGSPRLVDGDWDGTTVVDMGAYEYIPASKVLVQQTVSSTAATTVATEDGRIVIEFPAGSVVSDAVVTIREEPQPNVPVCPSGFKAGATCFSIELTSDLAPGATVTITIKYSDADLEACGEDPDLLTLSRYDEDAGDWVARPTTVDAAAGTLTATTDQLSIWMAMVREAPTERPASGLPFWVWIVVAIAAVLPVVTVVGLRLARR